MTLEQTIKFEFRIEPEELDELVVEAKLSEATRTNNEGIDAQLEYLREVFGDDLGEVLESRLQLPYRP